MNLSKYKKQGILLLLLLLVTTMSFAQNKRIERVRALKATYITEKLHLTPVQAERFWPIYDNYEEDLISTRQKYMKQNNRGYRTEEEARRQIEDNLDFQEAAVDLRRKYKNEFLKVISAQQVADLYAAEREFRQMLMQRLRQGKGRRGLR